MSANKPQTLRYEYSQATKILDAEYKPASLDDVIKTCENLHVEEQYQLKILLQKYEHLFDETLGEFNMEQRPISLQLMDPNCKPIHAPRSVEQQLQQCLLLKHRMSPISYPKDWEIWHDPFNGRFYLYS
jgi:hypothetical protein